MSSLAADLLRWYILMTDWSVSLSRPLAIRSFSRRICRSFVLHVECELTHVLPCCTDARRNIDEGRCAGGGDKREEAFKERVGNACGRSPRPAGALHDL